MAIQLIKDIEQLKLKVLKYCALVEENLCRAIECLETHDEKLVLEVIEQEQVIDEKEIEIEEECLKILALHQPVAVDLRYIVCIMKINNDLERIDDMAVHIVERFLSTNMELGRPYFNRLKKCAREVRKVIRASLDSLINIDLQLAESVGEMDESIDQFHEAFFVELQNKIKGDPENVKTWLNLIFISKQLERISDHGINIAEDVIYLIKGTIVRHSGGIS